MSTLDAVVTASWGQICLCLTYPETIRASPVEINEVSTFHWLGRHHDLKRRESQDGNSIVCTPDRDVIGCLSS